VCVEIDLSEDLGWDVELDVREAVALALDPVGWGVLDEVNGWLFLDGESIDRRSEYATHVIVTPWTMTVLTTAPFEISADRGTEVGRLCAALNAVSEGASVSIAHDGAPYVLSKTFLSAPETSAAQAIRQTVENRDAAIKVSALLARASSGEAAASIAADAGVAGLAPALEAQSEPVRSALLDLNWLSDLTQEQLDDAVKLSDGGIATIRETESLIRLQLLREAQLQGLRHSSALPVCAGPIVVHADGVSECYGCTSPLEHLHPAGTSFKCRPDRAFGDGHRCVRCERESDLRWGTGPLQWGRRAYELAVTRLQELLPPTWVWQLESSTDDGNSWVAFASDPETLTLQVAGLAHAGRVDVALSELAVPGWAHDNVVLFCAAANRSFRNWNTYLSSHPYHGAGPSSGSERLVSTGSFFSDESSGDVPPQLIESFVLHAIYAAIVAAPATRALIAGATVEEALAIADETYDNLPRIAWLREPTT
jgi:hypothetical protein